MDILVQKFGGTSVQTSENRVHVTNHIKDAVDSGYQLVVVVSAIGRKPDAYATDTLLGLVDYPDHYSSDRELDLLMSCGETISAVMLANELKKQRISATALTGAQAGCLTDEAFTKAQIKHTNTERIFRELETNDVLVVAGFQGRTEHDDITTIGRGGSDTTAAALGVALDAARIEIFTDVRGIMTADPQMVDEARPLEVATYDEICNLAYQGAEVVHPFAVEIAQADNIPMRVCSNCSTEPGTLVIAEKHEETEPVSCSDQRMTGIAHMSDVTQIQLDVKSGAASQQSQVFKAMAGAGISVDFINISPSKIIYTISHAMTDKAVHILESLAYDPKITRNCAKVSAVGAGITGVPGVTTKAVEALTHSGVEIFQSADSYTTIWVLVHDKDLKVAVNALHQIFGLDEVNVHMETRIDDRKQDHLVTVPG